MNCLVHGSFAPPLEDKGNDEQDQPDNKNDFGRHGRRSRQSAKSQTGSYHRDDKEKNGPTEHQFILHV